MNSNLAFEQTNQNSGRWEDLTIQDRFIFSKVMGEPENCLPLLQMLFPALRIEKLISVHTEKTQEGAVDAKSVRFDVYVKDQEKRAFTIEMQVRDTKELAKRSRYYAAMTDEDLLSKGQGYAELQASYVIFLCPFDLFGAGYHKYTFRHFCEESQDIALNDETERIFLNTKGTRNDVDSRMIAFLDYVDGKISNDPYVQQLEHAVELAKKNANWRREYMIWEMDLKYEKERAENKGREKGRTEGRAELIRNMHNNKYSDTEIARVCMISPDEVREALEMTVEA